VKKQYFALAIPIIFSLALGGCSSVASTSTPNEITWTPSQPIEEPNTKSEDLVACDKIEKQLKFIVDSGLSQSTYFVSATKMNSAQRGIQDAYLEIQIDELKRLFTLATLEFELNNKTLPSTEISIYSTFDDTLAWCADLKK
jgi:hypothetical protein